MPGKSKFARQLGETDEHWALRVERREQLFRQVREEIRFAAAGRGLTLSEVARRMGDPKGAALSSNAGGGVSLTKLADIGTAMGVTFRVVAIPDDNGVTYEAPRPHGDRKFTPDEVREIRRRVRAGTSGRQLARELGVASSSISDIVAGRAYKDVV
jgi:transcriptional regulator with XRE-family HTH domain